MPGILIIDKDDKLQAAENAAFFYAYFHLSHFQEPFDPAYIYGFFSHEELKVSKKQPHSFQSLNFVREKGLPH